MVDLIENLLDPGGPFGPNTNKLIHRLVVDIEAEELCGRLCKCSGNSVDHLVHASDEKFRRETGTLGFCPTVSLIDFEDPVMLPDGQGEFQLVLRPIRAYRLCG